MGLETIVFYVLAAVAVVASLLVVGQRNPMYSVVLLIVSFLALAALYIQLDAPFLAVIQIIIYAGAILVLFLFVVMLLNAGTEGPAGGMAPSTAALRRAGVLMGAILVVELVFALWQISRDGRTAMDVAARAGTVDISSVRAIGAVLFTDYALAFEVTSLLIIVAMVGAVVLAKRHV